MQDYARVVVIGGGVTGCSVIYHLAKMGWSDVVLLERKELTAGSSWHAAGNLFALTRPSTAQRLHHYTIKLYETLGEEADQPIGYHKTGGLRLARSDEEVLTLKIERARGLRNGIESEWISLEEAVRRAPVLSTADLKGVLWEPGKGHIDPSSVTHAFAAAARRYGATIYRNTPVLETTALPNGDWQIVTPHGTIKTEALVNASGLWAREVGALAGAIFPLMPVEHHYLVTEEIPELAAMNGELPVITDSEASYYARQEGKGMLFGVYEKPCTHWSVEGTPLDFGHELLPNRLDRIEENFTQAIEQMPALGRAGIKRVINGPMIFSPDLAPLIGPYPGLKNYYCAVGVMTAFNQGGGIGRVLAEWIIEGEPSLDVSCWDVARFGDWAGRRFTQERTKYFYENRSERVHPYREYRVGRPVRTFPTYETLKRHRAVFGFNYGWEIPLWFASPGVEPKDEYAYTRGNWWTTVGEECIATRKGVGLFEISPNAKYRVSGKGAEAWLDGLLAGRTPRHDGDIALSPMLSEKGRLIGDFSITRLDGESFLLVGAGSMQRIHMRWFTGRLPDHGVTIENLSERSAGLMIAGPRARDLLSRVARADVSSSRLPFFSGRKMPLTDSVEAEVLRLSFTGELGYELYMPMHHQHDVFDRLMELGADLGLRLAGSRAMMALRLEKSFPSWGLELSADQTSSEAGIDRFIDWQKPEFVGRSAAMAERDSGPRYRLSTLVVEAKDADCSGGEPVWRDGTYVGYITSGGYGHTVGESLALCYVETDAWEDGAQFEVELNGKRLVATLSPQCRFDPAGDRMRR